MKMYYTVYHMISGGIHGMFYPHSPSNLVRLARFSHGRGSCYLKIASGILSNYTGTRPWHSHLPIWNYVRRLNPLISPFYMAYRNSSQDHKLHKYRLISRCSSSAGTMMWIDKDCLPVKQKRPNRCKLVRTAAATAGNCLRNVETCLTTNHVDTSLIYGRVLLWCS